MLSTQLCVTKQNYSTLKCLIVKFLSCISNVAHIWQNTTLLCVTSRATGFIAIWKLHDGNIWGYLSDKVDVKRLNLLMSAHLSSQPYPWRVSWCINNLQELSLCRLCGLVIHRQSRYLTEMNNDQLSVSMHPGLFIIVTVRGYLQSRPPPPPNKSSPHLHMRWCWFTCCCYHLQGSWYTTLFLLYTLQAIACNVRTNPTQARTQKGKTLHCVYSFFRMCYIFINNTFLPQW